MTAIRAVEIGGAAVVATATAAGAVVESGLPGWASWVVPVGAGIVAGYYSARITGEKTMTRLETRLDGLESAITDVKTVVGNDVKQVRDEMRWYYQRKGPNVT